MQRYHATSKNTKAQKTKKKMGVDKKHLLGIDKAENLNNDRHLYTRINDNDKIK